MPRLPIAVLTVALIPTLASAQVEVGAVGGFYSPVSEFTVPANGPFVSDATAKHATALAYGLLGRVWLERRFGIEAAFLRSPSEVVTNTDFQITPDTSLSATVTFGTISGIARIPVGELPNPLLLSAGAVFVKHSGRAYRGLDNTSSIGGVIGIGTQVPITNSLNLDIGFKSLLYSMSLQDSLGTLPSSFQTDFVGWLGLSLRFGREFPD